MTYTENSPTESNHTDTQKHIPKDLGQVPDQVLCEELEEVRQAHKGALYGLHIVGVVQEAHQHCERAPEVRVELLPEVARELRQQAVFGGAR